MSKQTIGLTLGAFVFVIVTMLPNGHIVREVLLGEHGALGHARPGTVVLDTSSSDAAGTVARAPRHVPRRS